MKKLFAIFFLFLSLPIFATRYYIATTGTDGAGVSGDITHPWLTLSYACTRVASPDTIYVNTGDYTEANRCDLAVGVSIYGTGVGSHIIGTKSVILGSGGETDGTICLNSATADNGNQSISYIKLDGSSFTGKRAISVTRRNNVEIHHVTFVDFDYNAICFQGRTSIWSGDVTTFSTGNKFYNNTITNCGSRHAADMPSWTADGCINMQGQDGLFIYNNTITEERTAGNNGDIIAAVPGYNKGVKYYDNKSYKRIDEGAGNWNFHLELWYCSGGIEIYDNEFYGGLDALDLIGGINAKGSYSYSYWVHDNLFSKVAQEPWVSGYNYPIAVEIEGINGDVIVNNNYIVNWEIGVGLLMPGYVAVPNNTLTNIKIYCNIFENVGFSDNNLSPAIYISPSDADAIIRNIYIDNNTILSLVNTYPGAGLGAIEIEFGSGKLSNIYFRNNIVQNFYFAPIRINGSTSSLDSIYIQNNLYYQNGNSNNILYINGATQPVHFYETNNLKDNPDFVSAVDFHLTAPSPAVGTGIGVGLNLDYDGKMWGYPDPGDAPSIGAYESDADPPTPPGLPEITTTLGNVSFHHTAITHQGGGQIWSDGGGTITESGLCWSTSPNPTTSDRKLKSAVLWEDDFFNLTMIGLHGGVTYHYRAYCMNESGTTYGADLSFKTIEYSINMVGDKVLMEGDKILISK